MKKHLFPFIQLFCLISIAVGLMSCATAPRANQAIGQLHLGNPKKAWELIDAELKKPGASSPAERCEAHSIAVQILFNIATHDFAPADSDKIAASSYDYVCQNCQGFPRMVMVTENNYGNYLHKKRKLGQALPHYQTSLKLCQKGSYEHIMNENNLAACYGGMGLFELCDFHRARAIEIGRSYFKRTKFNKYKHPQDEFNEWYNYKLLLGERLDDLSWRDYAGTHLNEMSGLWQEIQAISRQWISKETQYADYVKAIQRFAEAGNTAFARTLLLEARDLTKKYPNKNRAATQLDLQIAEAKILLQEGKTLEAAILYRDWIERFTSAHGKSLGGNDYRLAGLAQEQAGKYDLAIDYLEKSIFEFEKMRADLKIEDRSRVLSGLLVTAYWGLIRSYAYQYLQGEEEKYFAGALQTARMLRARQFGELLGVAYRKDEASDLSRLKLKPDELLLDIMVTDKAIVVFAVAADRRDLYLTPIDGKSFNQIVQKARSGILDPSKPGDYANYLQEISRLILGPVRERLSDYRRLIIIPDGPLNGLPFTLFSKYADHYYPIIYDHQVTLMPSVSYLVRQRGSTYKTASDRVLALADPEYGSRGIPKSFSGESENLYKRAVNDLNLFTPLPETRTEVKNLSRFFQPKDVTMLFGERASETELKRMSLEEYRYLHFATHGILGNQIPGVFEPALVLAAEPENTGQDGYLTLGEVENLKLNSDLAVLSACDTGSGEYFTGEGVMGLSRAFLLSGSRSVIVSLWPVASDATVELMSLFYKNLRAGKSKADALRSAQLTLMGENIESASGERGIKTTDRAKIKMPRVHPFYWAPFVLIGE